MIKVLVKPLNDIQYKELELLKDSIKIPLNESLVNLENPLNYTTEFSKTISFPLTSVNRRIFGEYVNLDSIVTDRFSPADPIPVMVMDGSDVVVDGWFKITSVDISKKQIQGNIYGMMNRFFNELKNAKFGINLPELLSSGCIIDRNIVYNSWVQDKDDRTLSLIYPGQTGHNDVDIIGFAPTIQGQPDQFDSESAVWGQTTTTSSNHSLANGGPKILKYWEQFNLTESQANQATQIMKAPTERQTCQYRSYCQKPYVYMNKILQMFRDKAQDITDINFILDPDFFNSDNPLYTDVIYTLPNLITETSDSESHIEVTTFVNSSNYASQSNSGTGCFNTTTLGYGSNFTTPSTGTIQFSGSVNVQAILDFQSTGGGTGRYAHFNNQSGVIFRVKLKNASSGSVVQQQDIFYCYKTNTQTNSDVIFLKEQDMHYPNNYSDGSIPRTGSGNYPYHYVWQMASKNFNFMFENVAANTTYKITVDVLPSSGYGSSTSSCGGQWGFGTFWTADNMSPAVLQSYYGKFTSTMTLKAEFSEVSSKRSGSNLTMERIWAQSDPSPFEVVVKYAKLNNLVFVYDKERRTVTLMTRQKYFADSKNNILDWTNKIDWSKDMSFTPLTWDTRYICFNYDELDIDRLKDFKDNYGITYGSKKISTAYRFNNDTKDLLGEKNDNISPSATMSEFQYTTRQIMTLVTTGQQVEPELSNEYFIINRKGDKSANISNSFYFRNYNEYWQPIGCWDNLGRGGWTSFDSDLVFITDDSDYELQSNSFCTQLVWREQSPGYAQPGSDYVTNSVQAKTVGTTSYPKLACRPVFSEYSDDMEHCILFSVPREDYFNPNAVYYKNDNDMYKTVWESYINEVYSEHNKKLTCWAWLTSVDWYNFQTNKYIRINNVIYIVNKIIDYTPGVSGPTKVELIQIWDPDAYSR